MAAEIDFSKPPVEILVDLIKDANPDMDDFTSADVSFDDPTATSGDDALLRNTRIIVRSTGTGRFTGLKDVIYDRIPLSELVHHDTSPFVERTFQGTLRDLIPVINERFDVQLLRTDIVDQALPNVYGNVAVTLQTSSSSKIYSGSMAVTVRRSISLQAAVADKFLDGITHTAANPSVTAEDKLIERLNIEQSLTPYPFTHQNITFGAPAAISGPGYNTRVTITAVENQGFLNSVEVFYRRINLGDVITPDTVGLVSDVPFTPQSLIDKLNAEIGSFLRLEDLQPIDIATPETGVAYNVTLVAKATSLGWRGTCDLQVAVGVPSLYGSLNNIINVALPEAT